MPNPEHRKAQDLSSRASLLHESNPSEARKLFAEAAKLERKALGQVPKSKVRTRGILAVSLAALLHKAGLYREAQRTIKSLLEDSTYAPTTRRQLEDLLAKIPEPSRKPARKSSRQPASDLQFASEFPAEALKTLKASGANSLSKSGKQSHAFKQIYDYCLRWCKSNFPAVSERELHDLVSDAISEALFSLLSASVSIEETKTRLRKALTRHANNSVRNEAPKFSYSQENDNDPLRQIIGILARSISEALRVIMQVEDPEIPERELSQPRSPRKHGSRPEPLRQVQSRFQQRFDSLLLSELANLGQEEREWLTVATRLRESSGPVGKPTEATGQKRAE